MAKSVTNRLGQTRWSSGTDTVRRLDFDTDAANLESRTAIYGQGLFSARPAAGVEGRFYVVKGETSTLLNGRIYYDNGTTWDAPRFLVDGQAESSSAATIPFRIRQTSSPTADAFQILTSAGSPLFKVSASGIVSTQLTTYVTGGASLGSASNHESAGSFYSVSATKPVVLIKGAVSQTENLLVVRDSNNSTVFTVSPSGAGVFNGSVTASSVVSGSSVTGTSLTITGSTTVKNLFASPSNSNGVAATFASFSSPLNNIVDFTDSTGNRLARITTEGTFATNSRVVIGNNNGNSIAATYASTVAALYVNNSSPAAPVVRLVGNDTQSGKMLEIATSAGVNKMTVDVNGNTVISGIFTAPSFAVGAGATSPTSWFNGYTPVAEIITGTETGAYNQSIVVRHSNNSTTAASRTLNILMKLSDESSAAESAKYAGIAAYSTEASATNPNLAFIANNQTAGYFDATKNLRLNGSLYLTTSGTLRTQGGQRAHWILSSDENTHTIGLQNNVTYMRAPNFAWYAGGIHSNTAYDPGTGGTLLMDLRGGSDVRLTVPNLTLTAITPYDSTTPALSIGALTNPGSHMQFSNTNISVLDNTQTPLIMRLQQSGGTIELGGATTSVKIPSRAFIVGDDNMVYFGGSTYPISNPPNNSWWFDHTNETIKIRTESNTWKTIAA